MFIDMNTILYLLIAYFFISILIGLFAGFRYRQKEKKSALERVKKNIISTKNYITTSVKKISFKESKDFLNKKVLYVHSIIPHSLGYLIIFSRNKHFSRKEILFIIPELILNDFHSETLIINAYTIMKLGHFYLPITQKEYKQKLYKSYNMLLDEFTEIEENSDLYDIKSISLLYATEPTRRDKEYFRELLNRSSDQNEEDKKREEKE